MTDKIGSFPDGKILPMGNEWIKGLRNIRENTNHTIIYPREAVLVMREDGSHDADPVDSSEFKELRLALWKAKLDPTKFEYCPCTHGIYEVRSVTLMPQVQFVKRKEDEVDLNISFPVHAFEFSNCYDSEEAAVNAAKEFFIEMRGDLDSLLV